MKASSDPAVPPDAVAAAAGFALQSVFSHMLGALPGDGENVRDAVALQRLIAQGSEVAGALLAWCGQQVLVPQSVDSAYFLRTLGDALRRTLGTDFEVQVEVEGSCPRCRADPVALEAAVLRFVVVLRETMPFGGAMLLTAAANDLEDGSSGVEFSLIGRATRSPAAGDVAEDANGPGPVALALGAAGGFVRQSGGRVSRSHHDGTVRWSLVLPAG